MDEMKTVTAYLLVKKKRNSNIEKSFKILYKPVRSLSATRTEFPSRFEKDSYSNLHLDNFLIFCVERRMISSSS